MGYIVLMFEVFFSMGDGYFFIGFVNYDFGLFMSLFLFVVVSDCMISLGGRVYLYESIWE